MYRKLINIVLGNMLYVVDVFGVSKYMLYIHTKNITLPLGSPLKKSPCISQIIHNLKIFM